MGAAQSKNKLHLVKKAVDFISERYQDFTRRIFAIPGHPPKDGPDTYWHTQSLYPSNVININCNPPSNQCDVVIIGSGITAASVAYFILEACNAASIHRRIIVIESRTLCSGATARNNGSIKSRPWEMFEFYRQSIGITRAAAVIKFQLSHVSELVQMVSYFGWADVECREVETADIFVTEEERVSAFAILDRIRRHVQEFQFKRWYGRAAQDKFAPNEDISGAVSYRAAVMNPFAFVYRVWTHLRSKYAPWLFLKTNTSVVSIEVTKDDIYAYNVKTTDGDFKCNHVMHAENAYATQFIPGLRGKMTGVAAGMCAQRPGNNFPNRNGKTSWSIPHGKEHDTIVQRPTFNRRPGDVLVCGSFASDDGVGTKVGLYDDTRVNPSTEAHLPGIAPTIFGYRWGDQPTNSEPKTWAGIIAVTGDMLPFVGRLDPKLTGRTPNLQKNIQATNAYVEPGEWISAGYCGMGLCTAWLCGRAMAYAITGIDDMPGQINPPPVKFRDQFPAVFRPTMARMPNASLSNLTDRVYWQLLEKLRNRPLSNYGIHIPAASRATAFAFGSIPYIPPDEVAQEPEPESVPGPAVPAGMRAGLQVARQTAVPRRKR
ncbi:hypothetical protein M426DRAFT_69116 [Hypoxylon sp. CI-4A]|nr:hypothetical protein M426DRAFT_69116 [Hypoxylon sp. CI-4A]